MAILYIKRDSTQRWLLLGGAATVLGAVIGAVSMSNTTLSGPAAAHDAPHAKAGCCGETMARPSDPNAAALRMHGSPASLTLPERRQTPSEAVAMSAAAVYRQAQQYDDCRVLAKLDELGARDQRDDLFERDPSGALAASEEKADRARHEPCLLIGPYELRQIDALMRAAALGGNVDAKFFLLNQEARAQAERVDAAVDESSPADPGVPAALLSEVEAMARSGYRPAIDLALDLANSPASVSADPLHAAAWRLVVLQLDLGAAPSDDDLARGGALFGMDADAVLQARREAAALHAACCQAR